MKTQEEELSNVGTEDVDTSYDFWVGFVARYVVRLNLSGVTLVMTPKEKQDLHMVNLIAKAVLRMREERG